MRHKEFLIAFAEGKTVEARRIDGQGAAPLCGLFAVDKNRALGLFFDPAYEFRIKPRTIKVERWGNLRETAGGRIDERIFTKEHDARDDAQFLRETGRKVLAEAVHLCTEVEVAE